MNSQLTVRLPEELDERLAEYARRFRLKRSQVLRMALEHFFADSQLHRQQTTPYERVKDLIGSTESGIPDLGTAHREHLVRRMRKRA
jgi:predicted DNA-binding protein